MESPMEPLTIIAKLKAKTGAEDALFAACRDLVAPTLAEEGCPDYDLHRSVEATGLVLFYENWTTKPLWEAHMNSPHLSAFSAATGGMVEVWELFRGEKVSA